MAANKSLRSFNSIPDSTMLPLLATVEQGVKKAKSKGVIQRLELSKKGRRNDLVFGDLYLVPSSVCKSSEDFPTILLMAQLKHHVSPESLIDFKLHQQGNEGLDKDKLKMAKEELFTDSEGKDTTLMVFCPSWADSMSYVSTPYDEETAFHFLRDQVFAAPFNPSFSSVFEVMDAADPEGYHIDSIPEQQNTFQVSEPKPFYSLVQPVKTASASRKMRVTAAHKKPEFEDEEIEVLRALEHQIQRNIKDAGMQSFKVSADTLVDAQKRASQKQSKDTETQAVPEMRGTNLIMPDEPRVHPNDPDLDHVMPEGVTPKKRSSALLQAAGITEYQDAGLEMKGLRSRPDYGEEGSKETISSATVDGPDPKTAMFGLSQEERYAKGLLDVLHKEDRPVTEAELVDLVLDTPHYPLLDDLRHYLSMLQQDGKIIDTRQGWLYKCAAGKEHKIVPGPSAENISSALRLLDRLQVVGDEMQAGIDVPTLVSKAFFDLNRLHSLRISEEVMVQTNTILEAMKDKPAAWDWFPSSVGKLREAVKGVINTSLVDADVNVELEQKDDALKAASENKVAISFLVPGRVLENFYPELLNNVVEHPEVEVNSPNAVDPLSSTPRKPLEMLTGLVGTEPDSSASHATNPGPGGAGGVRTPYQSEGVPLRQENNVRGTNYYSDFYRSFDNISPSTLKMVSSLSKRAGDEQKHVFSKFLKGIMGDFVTSVLSSQSLNKGSYPFSATPTEFHINLGEITQPLCGGSVSGNAAVEALKVFITKMTDVEIAEALKSAWAQGAVWNDETDTSAGFTFEVYARAEKLDPATLILTLKFVTGIK